MEPIIGLRTRHHYDRIAPGPVAPVGDVLTQVRLKHNYPNAPIRYAFNSEQIKRMGSVAADGQNINPLNGGGPATLVDKNWNGHRSYMSNHGWKLQELIAESRTIDPKLKTMPDYSWNNKIATVNHSFNSGQQFTPLPYGYYGVGLPRGGSVPMVTDVVRPYVLNEDYHQPIFGVYPSGGDPITEDMSIIRKGVSIPPYARGLTADRHAKNPLDDRKIQSLRK